MDMDEKSRHLDTKSRHLDTPKNGKAAIWTLPKMEIPPFGQIWQHRLGLVFAERFQGLPPAFDERVRMKDPLAMSHDVSGDT